MTEHAVLRGLLGALPLIAPSMLKCDFANLHREVALLESAGAKLLHLDVMDGVFVPNFTYGMTIVEAFRKLTSLPLDIHLMMIQPQRYFRQFRDAGCHAAFSTSLSNRARSASTSGLPVVRSLSP